MKITIKLSPAEVLGIKNYLKQVDDIANPNKADLTIEIRAMVSACLQSPREAMSNYITDAEHYLNSKPNELITETN